MIVVNAKYRLLSTSRWTNTRLPPSAKLLDADKLAAQGFFLEIPMPTWIEEGDVILVLVPTSKCYQWEYKGGLKPDDPDVLRIAQRWDSGLRLPVITGTFETDGRYRINDGQHRWMAWQQQKKHKNKFIPMLLNT